MSQRWLARLAFSFVIVAAVLLWEAYRASQRTPVPRERISLYLVGALLGIVMGVLGIRARHRLMRQDEE